MIGGNKYQHIMFFLRFMVAEFIGYASTDKLNLSLYYYIKHINPFNVHFHLKRTFSCFSFNISSTCSSQVIFMLNAFALSILF